MKAFRGSLLAGLALLLVWGGFAMWDSPQNNLSANEEAKPLFRFEKHDVVRIEIERPDDRIVLSEGENGWTLEPGGFRASRSMVGRVQHQLHDLDARAKVIENPESYALYGLGDTANSVTVKMRDGEIIRFATGDPNPTDVSFYFRPLPGSVVYTVKKSAADYYSKPFDAFREPRFATFDAKDAVRLEADLPGAKRLVLQQAENGERWSMLEPVEMDVEADRAKALLGRVSALKAQQFVREIPQEGRGEELGMYGLDTPVARIQVSFGSRESLDLSIGRNLSEKPGEDLAYMLLGQEPTVYAARNGLLEDFLQDPQSLRNRSFIDMSDGDVREAIVFVAASEEYPEGGQSTLRLESGAWKWADGRPVPGSTPKRLVERITGVRASAFVDSPKEVKKAGLDAPQAKVVLRNENGEEVTLLVGTKGPPLVDEMKDEELDRFYAKVEGRPQVYLIDKGILGVIADAIRESTRKQKKDQEDQERLEAIDEAMEQSQ